MSINIYSIMLLVCHLHMAVTFLNRLDVGHEGSLDQSRGRPFLVLRPDW